MPRRVRERLEARVAALEASRYGDRPAPEAERVDGEAAPPEAERVDGETAPPEATATTTPDVDETVPAGLQIAASWAWRVLLVAALVLGLGWVLRYLSEVTVPLVVSILLTAMLAPVARRLESWKVPRAASTAITVLGGLAIIGGTLALIGASIAGQGATLGANVVTGFNALINWLRNGPLPIDESWLQLDEWEARITRFLTESQSTIASYATEIGSSVGHFLAGIALTLFSLFYFIYDGRGIFGFLLEFIPGRSRGKVDRAASRGWHSLSSFVRATILVALSDAVGVFIVAVILGVPLAPALAVLVFIGAFVPLVGAFVSGFVAVLIALVALGWVEALIMLGGIILVMQVEGHILQPFLLGRAVKLHPLAVIFAIAIGIILGGIVGALIAVPVLAFAKSFVQELQRVPDNASVVTPPDIKANPAPG